jgi:hypothetical protein
MSPAREADQDQRIQWVLSKKNELKVEEGLGVVAIVVIGIGASLLVVGHTHRITKASTTGSVSTQINNNQ